MHSLGVYKQIPKTKWQEITRLLKFGGIVDIYIVRDTVSKTESNVLNAIIAYKPSELEDHGKVGISGMEQRIGGVNRVTDVKILTKPVTLTPDHFKAKSGQIGSEDILNVSEGLKFEYLRHLSGVVIN